MYKEVIHKTNLSLKEDSYFIGIFSFKQTP